MAQSNSDGVSPPQPFALFVGDFNVGKSALINALLRSPILPTGAEESHSLPTVLLPGAEAGEFCALSGAHQRVEQKDAEEFYALGTRNGKPTPFSALAARVAPPVFSHLGLVDTPGLSSEGRETMKLQTLPQQQQAMLIVVTDVEYWYAKHTLELVAHHSQVFAGALAVVANKCDLMNAAELQRIQEKAARRMEEFGIARAPRFFTLSARLESRRERDDEGRRRVKRRVRELCDASFDQFRLCLHSFEARCCGGAGAAPLESVLRAPLVHSFVSQHQGVSL